MALISMSKGLFIHKNWSRQHDFFQLVRFEFFPKTCIFTHTFIQAQQSKKNTLSVLQRHFGLTQKSRKFFQHEKLHQSLSIKSKPNKNLTLSRQNFTLCSSVVSPLAQPFSAYSMSMQIAHLGTHSTTNSRLAQLHNSVARIKTKGPSNVSHRGGNQPARKPYSSQLSYKTSLQLGLQWYVTTPRPAIQETYCPFLTCWCLREKEGKQELFSNQDSSPFTGRRRKKTS